MLKPHSSRRSTACQIRLLPNTVRALNCGLVGNEVKLRLGNRLACLIGDFAAEQLPLLQVQSHSVCFLFHDLVAGMLGRTALGLRHQVPLPGTQLSKPDLAILIRFRVPRDQIALVMRGHSEFLDTRLTLTSLLFSAIMKCTRPPGPLDCHSCHSPNSPKLRRYSSSGYNCTRAGAPHGIPATAVAAWCACAFAAAFEPPRSRLSRGEQLSPPHPAGRRGAAPVLPPPTQAPRASSGPLGGLSGARCSLYSD